MMMMMTMMIYDDGVVVLALVVVVVVVVVAFVVVERMQTHMRHFGQKRFEECRSVTKCIDERTVLHLFSSLSICY